MNRPAGNGDLQALDKTIPRRIRSLRKSLGLTGADLDRLAGLGAGTTGRLERGDQRVYANHLYRIAQATGVEIGWFYGEAPDADAAAHLRDEQQRLLRAYLRITDPGVKRDVFDLVEALAKPEKP